MTKPDIILIDGHAYRWQKICEMRRQQLEAHKATSRGNWPCSKLKDD